MHTGDDLADVKHKKNREKNNAKRKRPYIMIEVIR